MVAIFWGRFIALGKWILMAMALPETVFLSAKTLINHHSTGGTTGSASVVFFDDAEKMPLEIGPVINTVLIRSGGNAQRPHTKYEMMVKYMNKPLAGARVVVHAMGSNWEKEFVTDKEGRFSITPTDDRTDSNHEWQTYLFMASHHDRTNSTYHSTTLPVIVYKNRPEWFSKSMGFTYWAIAGIAVSGLILLGLLRRREWREKRKIAHFRQLPDQRGCMNVSSLRWIILTVSFFVLLFGAYVGLDLGSSLPTFSCIYVSPRAGTCFMRPLQRALGDFTLSSTMILLKQFLYFSILVIIIGRAWCGWVCPLGFIQDLLYSIRQGLGAGYVRFSENVRRGIAWIKWAFLSVALVIPVWVAFPVICPRYCT